MGFGHRVYKNFDPRARDHQEARGRGLRGHRARTRSSTSPSELEKRALDDDYFIERKLYPNVDFYSGLIYEALNLPPEMFTVMFAIPRTSGWIAQWLEMVARPGDEDRPSAPDLHRLARAELRADREPREEVGEAAGRDEPDRPGSPQAGCARPVWRAARSGRRARAASRARPRSRRPPPRAPRSPSRAASSPAARRPGRGPTELFMAISISTAFSSPGSIVTSSMAAAESEWMFGRRVSNGMRERPLAMSSASATRTMPRLDRHRVAGGGGGRSRRGAPRRSPPSAPGPRRSPRAAAASGRRRGRGCTARGRCGGSTCRCRGTGSAAAITTSASRTPIPCWVTIAGSTPPRFSSRNSRSAMLTTIWMWTQEWSDMSRRSALTCCMYHQRVEPPVGVRRLEQAPRACGCRAWERESRSSARPRGVPFHTVTHRATRGRPRPRDLGPARVRDGPLQLPLPVLHAGRRPAVARPRRGAALRGDRAAGARDGARWA